LGNLFGALGDWCFLSTAGEAGPGKFHGWPARQAFGNDRRCGAALRLER
jgi:hypothetical protein